MEREAGDKGRPNTAPGPAGPRGDLGPAGPMGVPGAKGPKGNTGPRGRVGLQKYYLVFASFNFEKINPKTLSNYYLIMKFVIS